MTMMIGLTILLHAGAGATSPPSCPDDGGWLDGHAYLRALFLDLRGEVPTAEDYENLLVDGEVPRAVVEQLLAGRPFQARAVKFHQTLLWNDISDKRLLPNNSLFGQQNGILYVPTRANTYRGAPNRHCGNTAAQFDENGLPIPVTNADGSLSEGFVIINPYWDPDSEVQVCAFDAQEAEFSAGGTDCSTSRGFVDAGCGCGPDLRWCGTQFAEPLLMDSFARSVDKAVERMVDRDSSWLSLLTGSRAFLNGPMVDFYRHRTALPRDYYFGDIIDPDVLPDLAWEDDDTWVEVDLGPEHAGVLTSPVYLIRFQTNRARANQYLESFLCEPLQPPDGGLPALDAPNPTLDLTAREGCQYCHALLEPAGAHWGRWTQFGASFLDPGDYPVFNDVCAECAQGEFDCPDACESFYLINPLASEQDPFVGQLLAYEFLEERHFPNVEQGPKRIVNQHDTDGRLPLCAARQTAEWLLGREVAPSEDAWLEELATRFATNGYSWRSLVKDVVLSDAYRSVQ